MSTEPEERFALDCSAGRTEIRIRGKAVAVPSSKILGSNVIVRGKWIRIAAVEDEDCLEGEVVQDPGLFVRELKRSGLCADLFTFAQKPMSTKLHSSFHTELDNAAIIHIKDYATWFEGLSQETRRNIRKAAKAGVEVKVVSFDDNFVRGIVDIYNETPLRQGRRFWHYGKSIDVVKKETSTYLERSDFIGAYFEGRLIGFLKMLYVDNGAKVIHILSQEQHSDKRPTNALIAKAIEISAAKSLGYFQYCKYVYGGNESSPLTEFKRRNGFEQVNYQRYFVPISIKGRLALKLGLHHGLVHRLPEPVTAKLRKLREMVLKSLVKQPALRKKYSEIQRVDSSFSRV